MREVAVCFSLGGGGKKPQRPKRRNEKDLRRMKKKKKKKKEKKSIFLRQLGGLFWFDGNNLLVKTRFHIY